MSQLFRSDLFLWGVLGILVVLFLFVGGKVKRETELVGLGKRPMIEVEKNPSSLKNWTANMKDHARSALRWDFIFLLIYPVAIAISCLIAARFLTKFSHILFNLGIGIICLQLLTAIADATENFALLKLLDGASHEPWQQIARVSTPLKFTFLGFGLVYTILGVVLWVCTRLFRD